MIDYPAWLWQPLLQLVILSKRPLTSGHAYATIWDKELDESPLKRITRAQAAKLAERLEARSPLISVDWGMRYGNPSTAAAVERLVAQGCRRLVLMALYPQYAAATTATAYDKAFEALMRVRWQPAVRTMGPYHDRPAYIRLLAASVRAHLATLDWEPELLVMSYHGLPKRYLLEGDPYHCHCQKTSRLVREALGWAPEQVMVCFQSRFGREEWLQPYLDETLDELPGTRHQAHRRDLARLRLGLPGDPGGDRRPEPRALPGGRRRAVHLYSLPERQRRPYRPARGAGAGRDARLGVKACGMTAEEETIVRRVRLELEKLYGDRLRKVILYGSRARGDAHEEFGL